MVSLSLKNILKSKPAVRLVAHHIDSPMARAVVDRPQLDVRGWVAFDQKVMPSEIEISVHVEGSRFRVPLKDRPDVRAAHPNYWTFGFDCLIRLNGTEVAKIEGNHSELLLEILSPGGVFKKTIALVMDPSIATRSSYFNINAAEHKPATENLTPEQRQSWDKGGYLRLKNYYSRQEIDDIDRYIESLWDQRQALEWPVTVDEYIGTSKERRTLFSATSEVIRAEPYKLNDLYLTSEQIREMVLHPKLATLLSSLLYGGTPMICSSLYFERGSQQREHFDTFFMPPLIRNRMLATWIALEDVTEASGPLKYFPGSHKVEPYVFADGKYNLDVRERDDCYRYIGDELNRRNLKPQYFLAEKGDLFIWHPQLLHGGDAIEDSTTTRRSLVTHYFCKEDHPPQNCTEFSPNRYYLDRDFLAPTA